MNKEFLSKVLGVQNELNAPKNLYNKFGGYKYRNCESILEAVKPLCKARGLILTLTDNVIQVGERHYIQATATLTDGTDSLAVTAMAREEENKKGMDGSQITGASSSYARKYALNGLFLIDDCQDSDSTNTHGKEPQPEPQQQQEQQVPHHPQEGAILFHLDTAGSKLDVQEALKKFGINNNGDLSKYPALENAVKETLKQLKQ